MAENDTIKDDTIDLGENWDAAPEPHNTTQDEQSDNDHSTVQQDNTTVDEEKEQYHIDGTGGAIWKSRNTTGLNTQPEGNQGIHTTEGNTAQPTRAEAKFKERKG